MSESLAETAVLNQLEKNTQKMLDTGVMNGYISKATAMQFASQHNLQKKDESTMLKIQKSTIHFDEAKINKFRFPKTTKNKAEDKVQVPVSQS